MSHAFSVSSLHDRSFCLAVTISCNLPRLCAHLLSTIRPPPGPEGIAQDLRIGAFLGQEAEASEDRRGDRKNTNTGSKLGNPFFFFPKDIPVSRPLRPKLRLESTLTFTHFFCHRDLLASLPALVPKGPLALLGLVRHIAIDCMYVKHTRPAIQTSAFHDQHQELPMGQGLQVTTHQTVQNHQSTKQFVPHFL